MNKAKKIICTALSVVVFSGALLVLCCCLPYADVHVDGVYAQVDFSSNTAIVYGFDRDASVGRYDAQVCYVPETIYYDGEVYTVTELSNMYYETELVLDGGHAKRIVIPASVTRIDLFSFRASDCFDYLEEIEVHQDNPNYTTVKGVLYTKNCDALVMYPPAKRDTTMIIKSSVTEIYSNQLNYSNKYVEKVSVEEGNPVFSEVDGVLYSSRGALEYVPYAYGNVLELPDGVECIAKWALRYANVEHLYVPASVTSIEYSREVFYNPLRYVTNVYFEEEQPFYAEFFGSYLMNVHVGVSREAFAELTATEQ